MADDKGGEPTTVSDATFEAEVLKSSQPVLVDFFAEWCGPCKAMAPALAAFAADMKGKVKVVKLDVDQSSATAQSVGIRAMPTLIIFKDGKEVGRHVGALVQKKNLADWVATAI